MVLRRNHRLSLVFFFSLTLIASAAPHKLRVSDPALARSIIARGGKLVADYGGFQLVEADDSIATNLTSPRIEWEDDDNEIKLNAVLLDTSAPQLQSRKPAGNFSGKRLLSFSLWARPNPNGARRSKRPARTS